MNYFKQESSRLYTVALEESDIKKWYPFFENNDSLSYLGLDLTKSTGQLAEGWIRAQLKRYKESGLGHLAIRRKEDHLFVGLAGLIPRRLDEKDYIEITYSFLPEFWGLGYATEIASMFRDYACGSMGPNIALISLIHPKNKRSANVAQKNGMQKGRRTNYINIPVDIYYFNFK